jgi:type IV pilus assembly protein PilC
MKFHYKGKNKDGTSTEGTKESPDKFSLAKELREQGVVVIELKEIKQKGSFSIKSISFFEKISISEKILFTRNLSGMITAGLSLARALQVLEKQTKNKKLKTVLTSLSAEINQGGNLSSGMAKFPDVFSTLFVSMVKAGEESGSLSASLKEVGVNLEKTYELRKKVKGAMTYPSIIVGAIVIIGVLMMIYVVPTLTKTFGELGIDLPPTTKFIIFMSESLKNHILIIIVLFVAMVVGLKFLLKTKKFRDIFDSFVLKLPVIGQIVKEINSARTARTLSSLLMAGVSVTKSLDISKDVIQNGKYKAVLEKAVKDVEKGVALSSVFKERVDLYPVMVGEMMEVGEETGKFTDMLVDIAKFYEEEVDSKTKNLSTIIEPVLMVFIGGAVGFFALSMITPMYSILDTI